MFLLMSICLFTGGSHVTIRYGSLPPTLKPGTQLPLDMEPETPLVVTSGEIIIGDLFRLVRWVHFWTPPPTSGGY